MAVAAPQHFDRHRAARAILLRGVDDAHAAGADRVQHEKAAEAGAWLQRAVDRRHVERRNAFRIEKSSSGTSSADDQRLDFAAEVVRRRRTAHARNASRSRGIDVRPGPGRSTPRLPAVTLRPSARRRSAARARSTARRARRPTRS